LLVAEPRDQKERDHRAALALLRGDKEGFFPIKALREVDKFDPASVMVYRIADLERAKRDLVEGLYIAWGLTTYLDGIFTGRRPLPPKLKESATTARVALFQRLYEKRLFREALDRIRAGRQSKGQTPPSSPPPVQPGS
jgi:hypothetical protein